MRLRIAVGLIVVSAGLFVVAGSSLGSAQGQEKSKIAPPKHLYGHDLRVRKGGNPDFDKDTPRIGVEFFHDEATKAIVVISESGSLAVSKAPTGKFGDDKKCEWKTAHDLHCRKAGEPEFTKATKKWGVEMFHDRGTNQLLYVCESASVALAPVPAALVTNKGPKWHHALDVKVRAPEQTTFDNAKKLGMEIFRDENTNDLMYITEVGAVTTATSSAPTPDPKKIAAPKTQYGLVLRVRGADEPNFTDKTKQVGLEVYEDPNANLLFYITESGSVATAPNPGKYVADAKGVTWKGAMLLRARKGGQGDWNAARKFGVEVFEDNRTGNLIFISETGAVAVLPK
jgi:hypothetical protein